MGLAERVFFLGVGFNNENMSRIGVFDLAQGRAMSTGMGLTAKQTSDLTKRFGVHVQILQGSDCMSLFRNYAVWGP
jgi:hypothetical protein